MAARRESRARRTRGGAATVALALAAALAGPAGPAGASHYSNTIELSGSTNVAAAAAWSRAAFPTTTAEVLLGRDDVFADSLASGSMQGSRPLLLTTPQSLSPEAKSELDRLRPSVVNILGGTSAVSSAVEQDLENQGYTVRRFSGPTRIETAIDVARRTSPNATTALLAAAFQPQGGGDETRAFADSIAAGGWAAASGRPVLLTQTETLTTSTRNYLRTASITTVVIVGGTAAVSEATAQELRDLGLTVRRVSGPTRFDTAVRIAQERGFSDATDAGEVIITEGQAAFAWAPGFAAAAYSNAKDAPIILSNGATVPPATNDFLTAGAAAATTLVCAARMQSTACDAATQRMGHAPITGAMPQLASAALSVAAGGSQEILFTFTEPLAGQPTAARFKCYTYTGEAVPGSSATIPAGSPTKAAVSFSKASADLCTTAAVAFDAVRSGQGVSNPEGTAPLRSYTRPKRVNAKPMLIGGALTPTPALTDPQWTAVYEFDKPVSSTAAASSFALVLENTDATVVRNGSTRTAEGNTVTVVFDLMGTFSKDDLRRFAVEQGGVENGPASVFREGTGITPGPNLSRLEVPAGGNTVVFVFDRELASPGAATGYGVYDEAGTSYLGTAAAFSTEGSVNLREVRVTLPPQARPAVIVGGWVATGTVQSANATGAGSNGLDERGVDRVFPAGQTNAPRLDSVSKGSAPTGGTRIRFTFSESIEEEDGGYFVYDEAGGRITLPADDCGAVGSDVICDIPTSASNHADIRDAIYAGVAQRAIGPATQSTTGGGVGVFNSEAGMPFPS